MKKLTILFLVITLIFAGCAKKDISPLSPDTDVIGSDSNPVEFTVSGIEETDSMGVDPEEEASWIYVHFNDVIDENSTGIKVEETDGDEVSYDMEWEISGGQTDLTMKPQDELDYNTTYIIRVIGSEVSDNKGNNLDLDGDEVGGEEPDDNYAKVFQTCNSDGTDGDWPWLMEDYFYPTINTSLYAVLGGSYEPYYWTDVDLAIDVTDQTWASDTTMVPAGVDVNTVNENTVILIERDSGDQVAVSDIDYEADTSNTDFGRITLKPDENLKPGTWYTFKLLGEIADEAGNKLDKNNVVAFEEEFLTMSSDHDSSSVADDVIPPSIDNWIDGYSYFEVEFSEKLDETTVNASTIYLIDGGERVPGGLTVMIEDGKTVVRFTPSQVYVNGTAYVTGEIKDVAGNKKGDTSTNTF